MAKASIKVETVTKKVEVEEELFTLTLNRDEAEVLHDIFAHIAGHPERSRRGIVNGVQDALASVLMTPNWCSFGSDIGMQELTFKDNN